DSPSSWGVAPGAGNVVAAPNGALRGVLGGVVAQDVNVLTKVVLPRCNGSNCDAFVMGRVTSGSNPSYYRVGAIQGQPGRNTVYLRAQRSDGGFLVGDVNTGIPSADGVVLWMRVQFQGINPTVVRGRIWLDGTAEPASWLLNVTDAASVHQISGA